MGWAGRARSFLPQFIQSTLCNHGTREFGVKISQVDSAMKVGVGFEMLGYCDGQKTLIAS